MEVPRRLLWWLLVGTRGGPTRARIIHSLEKNPQNANQLAQALKLDYKTVRHHLQVLVENRFLVTAGEGYAKMYFHSPVLEACRETFLEIWKKIEEESEPVSQ
ncbi:MAG: winged helix-turn-helix transcriptional regulator [Candidatus Brockarchaeota archaeon]|nr:winged helix-turn-helix transcriptional regulator [Candidatus Brockarchaeota archaeon]